MAVDKTAALNNPAELSFEIAMQELEQIVSALEKGSISLDDSVALYARGKILQDRCEKLLSDAESRIEKIALGENGEIKGVKPLDID
ncbi:MAG: exodeoxyribonuclease VII small subunit [Methylocystaceae bacterium]|jgi:exodeoxyribonuclease VII small subunit|nr:exodeoxyribonuclease VII small subunit [Methylocystaceae bacterium]